MRIIRDIGRGFYNLFIGTLIVALIAGGVALATNYTMTQGVGTTFGSLVVSAVNYVQMLSCDPTTPTQCGAVDASGNQAVKDAAVLAAVQAPIPDCNAGPPCTNRVGSLAGQPDPCFATAKTNVAIATSSGTFQAVAPSGSTQVYVCSFSVIAGTAAVVNLVGGTGATCTTGTPLAAMGSTTPSGGMSLAANGGLTFGNGGSTVTRTTTAGHGLCLIQSGTSALAGNITYVQQ